MPKSLGSVLTVQFLAGCLGAALVTSCSTPTRTHTFSAPVAKVDFRTTPQAKVLAAELEATGNRMYPQVCALLSDGSWQFPRQFTIRLKKQLPYGRMGETRMNEIWLNTAYLDEYQRDPALLQNVLVHEMAHVAQHYYRPLLGRWLVYDPGAPGYWVEGIADYVCFKLCQTNSVNCAECGSAYPHYRNGYKCAGAFLLFIERNSPDIVSRLNTALRQGEYSDSFFWTATGKDLTQLWSEFQNTPAFTASAARMYAFQEELGFHNGKAPKNLDERLETYLDKYADSGTKKLLQHARLPGASKGDVQARLAIAYYFTQPGGTAEAFMVKLQENGKLPGFRREDHGTITGFLHSRNLDLRFPVERSFTATKVGDTATYNYVVTRESEQSPWLLQRAWRTTPAGATAQEYNITKPGLSL